jgi:hypothetical protein
MSVLKDLRGPRVSLLNIIRGPMATSLLLLPLAGIVEMGLVEVSFNMMDE